MNRARYELTIIFALVIALAGISAANNVELGTSLGEQRRWTIDFRTQLNQSESSQSVQITLTGDWASTIVAVRPGEYDAALELRKPQFTGKGIGSITPRRVEELERRLSRRFWATYRKDG